MPDSSLCRAAAPRLHPLQLLLPALRVASIRFDCRSLFASASAAALDCIHFNCSSIASASAAAPRLHPLQLLLPDCVRFNNCCSPIASDSTAAHRLLRLLLPASCSGRFQPSNVLEHSSRSSRFSKLKYKSRASLVPPHIRYTPTHTHTVKILMVITI